MGKKSDYITKAEAQSLRVTLDSFGRRLNKYGRQLQQYHFATKNYMKHRRQAVDKNDKMRYRTLHKTSQVVDSICRSMGKKGLMTRRSKTKKYIRFFTRAEAKKLEKILRIRFRRRTKKEMTNGKV